MKHLILMMGIPGSGKSTWLRENILNQKASEFHYISPDQYIEEQYDYDWTPQRAAEAWHISYQKYGQVLLEGQNIVWDATFVQRIGRSALLHIAKGMGYHCQVVWVVCDLDVALERNRKRLRNPVPDSTITNMWKNLEKPTLEEGFDEVTIIDSNPPTL